MAIAGKSASLAKLVARRVRDWELASSQREHEGQRAASVAGPYVSISRAIGSHGRIVATRLAERLHWQYYEREIVEYIAKRAQVREAVVKSLGETRRDELENWVSAMIDSQALPETAYVRHLVAVLTAIAAHGDVVILGRGAQFILPPAGGLRVRLVAPHGHRVRAAMEDYGISEAEAGKLINDSDRAQARFYRSRFGRDATTPSRTT